MDSFQDAMTEGFKPKKSASPRISIAMATYNGEKYIREQLESLAAQTLLPCELVVTDDGSNDRTIEIIEDFARIAPFDVRIHCNAERLGYGDNFMFAASLCRGEFISFCDQDDIWFPEKLLVAVSPFQNPDVGLSSHNAIVIDEDGACVPHKILRHHMKTRDVFDKRYWGLYFGFTLTFRNHEIFRLGGTALRPNLDFGLQHDQFVSFLYMMHGKVGAINSNLVKYRRHINNVSDGIIPPPFDKHTAMTSCYRQLRRRCLAVKSLNWPSPELNREKMRGPLLIARHLRARRSIYDKSYSINDRLGLLASNIVDGVYSEAPRRGLGLKALVVDILFTLFPLLIKTNLWSMFVAVRFRNK